MPLPLVWFITGASSGFGAALALHALRSGHAVIATARNPQKDTSIFTSIQSLGGTWLTLDVTASESSLAKTIETAIQTHGRIDILVNNAGYALLGAFETFSDEECRAQMETNFFGPLALMRLVLPSMRARRSGTIINISSTAGIEAKPSRSLYSGSKFALEGASEALHDEVKELGIRVLVVEPGAFRTKFGDGLVIKGNMPSDYQGSMIEKIMDQTMGASVLGAKGDVEKGAKAIFDVVMKEGQGKDFGDWLRLPLGKDGSARWEVKIKNLKENLDATEKIWSATDIDET